MICEKEHKDEVTRALARLDVPQSQKLVTRHLCAACAFEAGFAEGVRLANRRLVELLADVEADFERR